MIAQLDADYIRARPTKALSRLLSYALFEGRPVTTRGQWINPLVFAHFAVEKRLPQLKSVRRPIFIVGTGRSGTTILGKILSLHRDVGFLNEPKALWHAIHPHEDVIGSYDRGAAAYRLGAEDASAPVVRHAHRLFGAYLAAVGATRVVDKYPELIFRIPFVRSIFPDARFIWIVRDGWDTIRSIDRWSDRLGETRNGEQHDWWGVDDRKWRLLVEQVATTHPDLAGKETALRAIDRHIDRAALEWALTMQEGIARQQEHPEAITTVRYEALAGDPPATVRRLLDACGLPPDAVPVAYARETVHAAPRKEPVDLHPVVAPVFQAAMDALGIR
jgi:hypothetical protein